MSPQKHKILLVDDEPDVLEFLGYNLRKEGYQVYSCPSGDEAVIKAGEILPHLIILDVMMPGMDGIETCAQIRQLDNLQNAIVKHIIEAHKQTINVRSTPDVGTTFGFTLKKV